MIGAIVKMVVWYLSREVHCFQEIQSEVFRDRDIMSDLAQWFRKQKQRRKRKG